jgi:hypothetical protein
MQHVPYLLDAIMDLKGWGLMGTKVIHTFIGRWVLPLKMRHHPKWVFRGPTDPTIKSRVTIHKDDLDKWVMKVMGEYIMGRGTGSPQKPSAPTILHQQTDLSLAWSHTRPKFLLMR